MVLTCMLCHCGTFSDLSSLISALTTLARCPLVCPLSHCGHTEQGLDNLIQHLSSHQASDNIDNIDQVIRDLEDLVQTDITLKSESPTPKVIEQGSGGWLDDWSVPSSTPSIAELPVSSDYYSQPQPGRTSNNNLTIRGRDSQLFSVWRGFSQHCV